MQLPLLNKSSLVVIDAQLHGLLTMISLVFYFTLSINPAVSLMMVLLCSRLGRRQPGICLAASWSSVSQPYFVLFISHGADKPYLCICKLYYTRSIMVLDVQGVFIELCIVTSLVLLSYFRSKILPGFMSQSGSKLDFIALITSIGASPTSSLRNSFFPRPTPCSPW